MLKIEENNLKLLDKRGQKIVARQMLKDIYIRNGVFYIFNIEKLMQNKSIYLKNIYPSITNYKTANIDNLDDLNLAKKLMK